MVAADRRSSSARAIRGFAFLGQAGVVVLYGFLGVGIAGGGSGWGLFGGFGGADLRSFVSLLEMVAVVLSAILAEYVAIVLCAIRVHRGDLEGARLPMLWMTVGNFGAAGVGGIVEFPALTDVAAFLGLVYLTAFLLDDRHLRRYPQFGRPP
jgi:hypothetical protein